MFGNFVGVLFDGLAYGSLMFVISIGLSVTMGLMNFVNLAHGAFAMVGGYVCAILMSRFGVPFLVTLPIAFLAAALVGIVLERTLYQRLYKASPLDQVLFSIGLTFMSIAVASYFFGPSQQPVHLPGFLLGQVHVLGIDLGIYRLFLIAVVVMITLVLGFMLERTRFGAQVRASVDNQQAAAGMGINVNQVFAFTFALGSGLAGIGGALGIDVLGLDPNFPLKYMVYFLLVVAVGGAGSIKGSLVAAVILGVFDVAGKYYVPQIGAFIIYALMVILLVPFRSLREARQMNDKTAALVAAARAGLARPQRGAGERWHPLEIVFWVLPLLVLPLFPGYLVLGSQVLIVGLFALSLDLILGYAGILSLGHAAFFGLGAYVAGLLAVHGWGEPISGLLIGGLVAALLGFVVSFIVVRGNDLTQLMVTLGIGLMLFEAANKVAFITGGVDGLSGVTMWKLLGLWEFGLVGKVAYIYSLVVLFVVFLVLRRLVHSPFGLALRGLRDGPRRMPAIGASTLRLQVKVFTIGAGVAGVAGALLAQTTQFVGLESLGFTRSAEVLIMLVLGGTGRLYGALIGTAVFMLAQAYLAGVNPVYWQFWIGLLLVVIVMFARGGILGAGIALFERFGRKAR